MNIGGFIVALVVNVVFSCIIGYFAFPEPGIPYEGFIEGFIWGGLHGPIFMGNWILGTFVYDPNQHLFYSAESDFFYKFFYWLSAAGVVLQMLSPLFKK